MLTPLMGLFLVLTSCSRDDQESRPSLNADDLWDRMAEERKTPLPVVEKTSQAGDSSETLDDQHSEPAFGPLSLKDIEAHRNILRAAQKKYQDITAFLETDFQALLQDQAEAGQGDLWRTMQLHLSRLTTLQKNMERAINGLALSQKIKAGDPGLLDNSRDLLSRIAQRIIQTRKRLNEFIPQ